MRNLLLDSGILSAYLSKRSPTFPLLLDRVEKGDRLGTCTGQIASHLRRIGRPMQSIDIMMAAVSLAVGNCTIITTDSDLESVPGINVEKWTV